MGVTGTDDKQKMRDGTMRLRHMGYGPKLKILNYSHLMAVHT